MNKKQEKEIIDYLVKERVVPSWHGYGSIVVDTVRAILRRYDLVEKDMPKREPFITGGMGGRGD